MPFSPYYCKHLLGRNVLLNALCSNTLKLCCSLNVRPSFTFIQENVQLQVKLKIIIKIKMISSYRSLIRILASEILMPKLQVSHLYSNNGTRMADKTKQKRKQSILSLPLHIHTSARLPVHQVFHQPKTEGLHTALIFMLSDSRQTHCQLQNLKKLTFRHHVSCIFGQAFHYSPENAFYIFNQQIYFII